MTAPKNNARARLVYDRFRDHDTEKQNLKRLFEINSFDALISSFVHDESRRGTRPHEEMEI